MPEAADATSAGKSAQPMLRVEIENRIALRRDPEAGPDAGRFRPRLVMSEPGETDGYTAADIIATLRNHAPRLPIHDVLLNSAPIPEALAGRYAAGAASPIAADPGSVRALGCKPVIRDLLGSGPKIRHDPAKLARVLLDLAAGRTS